MAKNWQLAPTISQEFREAFPEIHQLILQLLFNRGLTTQPQIDEFLNPDYGQDIHDPFLFSAMAKAIDKTLTAIVKKENIVVYGDYDADGVSSTAVMTDVLQALGGQVKVYIPFRETEGYGLNLAAVESLIKEKTNLIITVDCGIGNAAEIAALKKGGVTVIVTDHHSQPKVLPDAFALINPNLKEEKYPFRSLAGCGVAYKFAQALVLKHRDYPVNQLTEGFEKWLLDLVAIGTVADMMPLLGENRTLVRYGLVVLQKTKRPGLKQLMSSIEENLAKLNEHSIGFRIAPRLNAAGRLQHANTAYELLVTQAQAEAESLAQQLNATNQQRQQLTDQIYQEAIKIIGQPAEAEILAAVGNGWPTGIVGLVAGRLTDRVYRPSLVISRFGGSIIGSGRSIKEFNITQALQKCDGYLTRYGGHAQACGFTLKDESAVEPFIEKIKQIFLETVDIKKIAPAIQIDAVVELADLNWDFFGQLEQFRPFGEGNPKPIFLAKNLEVADIQTLGQDKNHLKLLINDALGKSRKIVGFSFGSWFDKIKKGDKIDLVFDLDVNEWKGNRELQLKIIDLKLCD